jgi:cytokinesis protein
MLEFSIEKKWLMVSQDKQVEAPIPSISSSTTHHHIENTTTKNSPDFYIEKFLEPDMKGVTPRLVAHLAVSLRTMPLSWVRQFIEAKGLQIITNIVSELNTKPQK